MRTACAAVWLLAGAAVAAQDWATSLPGQQGLDEQRLAEMDSHATAALPHMRSLLIARHGVLVFEKYRGGASPNTRSTTCS